MATLYETRPPIKSFYLKWGFFLAALSLWYYGISDFFSISPLSIISNMDNIFFFVVIVFFIFSVLSSTKGTVFRITNKGISYTLNFIQKADLSFDEISKVEFTEYSPDKLKGLNTLSKINVFGITVNSNKQNRVPLGVLTEEGKPFEPTMILWNLSAFDGVFITLKNGKSIYMAPVINKRRLVDAITSRMPKPNF